MNTTQPSALAAAKQHVMAAVPYVRKCKVANLNYSFAGESDLIASLRPAMLQHGLSVAPIAVAVLEQGRFQTVKGSLLNHVLVAVTYRMTHAPSGECEECQVLGEASDAGDKAAAKALTGAYKYFLRQSFLIETGDDPDRYASADQEAAPAMNGKALAKKPASERPLPERLAAFDGRCSAAGLTKPGEVTEHVRKACLTAGFGEDMTKWNANQIGFAIATAKGFEATRRQPPVKA
jgi:hypothetical protein